MRLPSGLNAACQTPPRVALEHGELPALAVPQARGRVHRRGDDTAAVGAERRVPDLVRVAREHGIREESGRCARSTSLIDRCFRRGAIGPRHRGRDSFFLSPCFLCIVVRLCRKYAARDRLARAGTEQCYQKYQVKC